MKIDAVKFPVVLETTQDADGFPIDSTAWEIRYPV